MIQSMTGYGCAVGQSADRKITVEVRSLNGKSFDLSLRLPSIYRGAEQDLRSLCAQHISRGKAEMMIQYEVSGADALSHINRDAFRAYYKELLTISREVGYDLDTEPLFGSILRLPDVLASGDRVDVSPAELAVLSATAATALKAFNDFRTQEGAVLIADLLPRVATIERLLTAIEPFEAERIATVRARLKENLDKAAVAVDNNRFEAEIIYYLEKFDVTEEKVRLKQHLNYFRQVASQGGDAGRKLGFIAQEMGREINTLGSKANHHDMQRLVVEMKDELEKIKEQVL
ncbi:MAG: YicC/YloC family endoribonuclease, partial [Mucinivorans sp.]